MVPSKSMMGLESRSKKLSVATFQSIVVAVLVVASPLSEEDKVAEAESVRLTCTAGGAVANRAHPEGTGTSNAI